MLNVRDVLTQHLKSERQINKLLKKAPSERMTRAELIEFLKQNNLSDIEIPEPYDEERHLKRLIALAQVYGAVGTADGVLGARVLKRIRVMTEPYLLDDMMPIATSENKRAVEYHREKYGIYPEQVIRRVGSELRAVYVYTNETAPETLEKAIKE